MSVRLSRLVLPALLLCSVAGVAMAQTTTSSARFGGRVGVSAPIGDLGDIADLGIHGGVHLDVPFPSSSAGLRLEGDFGRYSGKGLVDNVTLGGFLASARFQLQDRSALRPYLLGGIGMYRVKTNLVTGGSGSASDIAFAVGGGYDFRAGNLDMFTEARYVTIRGDNTSTDFIPIALGIRF